MVNLRPYDAPPPPKGGLGLCDDGKGGHVVKGLQVEPCNRLSSVDAV